MPPGLFPEARRKLRDRYLRPATGKWQAAILKAEENRPDLRLVSKD